MLKRVSFGRRITDMTSRMVTIETLGCKLNQAECESLKIHLLRRGYSLTTAPEKADIYVLNTCTVTHIADRKSRHRIRWVRRNNPRALIAAVGCYAQRAGGDLLQAGADLILDNTSKEDLPHLLGLEYISPKSYPPSVFYDHSEGRTRAMVKIQSGCNDHCTFCIVPSVRGCENSVPVRHVIECVRARIAEGHREVVLTGTKLGAYRSEDVGELPDLVNYILSETGVERLRLSSLQPQDLTPRLLKLWSDGRICNHLHLSLQSGNDQVLQQMRRRYSTEEFANAVGMARRIIPDLAITTDVIVGFPGEDEEKFEDSYRFCESMAFANIHVFPYSPRPGTMAEKMPFHVNGGAKKERVERMLALAQRSAQQFRTQFLGKTVEVLWEHEVQNGVWTGLTPNYLRVFARGDKAMDNHRSSVKLFSEQDGNLWGSCPRLLDIQHFSVSPPPLKK